MGVSGNVFREGVESYPAIFFQVCLTGGMIIGIINCLITEQLTVLAF